MITDAQAYAGATALGVMAGMRSMSAPALISQVARKGQLAVEGSKLGFLNSRGAISTTALLALGEIVADKLPSAPARTNAGSLITRAVSGAFSGAVLCSAKKKSPWLGAFYGTLGALGGTFAAYHLRRSVEQNLKLPDVVVAVAEDAVVAASAFLIARQFSKTGG